MSDLHERLIGLTAPERHALRFICNNGDYVDTPAGRVLVVPLPDQVARILELFESDAEDLEPEPEFATCSDGLPGSPEDVEEDDPPGGNIEDEGEAVGTCDEPNFGDRGQPIHYTSRWEQCTSSHPRVLFVPVLHDGAMGDPVVDAVVSARADNIPW